MEFFLTDEQQARVQQGLYEIHEKKVVARIWQHDHTLWSPEPTEISNRLGWLHCPESMPEKLPEIEAFVREVISAGFTRVLLLGMGGSSLAPEVFRKTFGVQEGYPDLAVLDSTHPEVVLSHAESLNPKETLFLVSTKSGGTVETLSLFKYFFNRMAEAVGKGKTGAHFVAITDPGSALQALARELKFRKVFLNDPNIGGRFSALSFFGLVPAALVGVDIKRLLQRAQEMAQECRQENIERNSAASFGASLGELAAFGRDKLTFVTPESLQSFGAWAEQLIAESTGKNGKGILPVDGEEPGSPDEYEDDRCFVFLKVKQTASPEAKVERLKKAGFPVVELNLNDLSDLGAEFFRWEFATAVAGERLGIQPFDQPDVESAKVQARAMVQVFRQKGRLPEERPTVTGDGIECFTNFRVKDFRSTLIDLMAFAKDKPGEHSYVAIHAYLPFSAELETALQALRHKLRRRYKLAVTLGYGPRFLHSTGQLHKGDAGHGLFIQLTALHARDAAIPDEPGADASGISFGVLIAAQAMGDRQALMDKGRKVIRYHFTGDVVRGVQQLTGLI